MTPGGDKLAPPRYHDGMAKPAASPLIDAAAAFDDVLAAYARLAERFVNAPLSSVKHLERANATLDEIAACEPRLQAAAQVLLGALGDARARQERLAGEVVARAPELERKNRELRTVMDDMTKLATEVGELNASITSQRDEADSPDVADVAARVMAMSERAQQLAMTARDAGFDEVASQAHALHQRLLSIGKTLTRAAPN
jgi:septal ring factor EnvC (AmiA/AmiB activator)